jgi:lambda family phage minor tail protein L
LAIEKDIRKLAPDALVTLYIIDTRPIGGTDIYRFTKAADDAKPVQFDGYIYQPIDIEATGFKWDGKGPFPKPKLSLVNTSGLVTAALITYGDLVGAKFIRIRTFAKHLDDGADPDPSATFPLDIYTVNQRTAQNKVFVEWQLGSSLDLLNVQLPRRQCLRDTCTHTYRVWDAEKNTWDYKRVTCPYTGTKYWDENGKSVTLAKNDRCGKQLSDCQLRFGEKGELPTRAFPGIAMTQGR